MKTENFLQLLNAKNEEDVLRCFPIRYEDLTPSDLPFSIGDGDRICVIGRPYDTHTYNKAESSLIKFKMDYKGKILDFLIINQPYYLYFLNSKRDILVIGYYSSKRSLYGVKSILYADNYFVKLGFRPIYNLPRGISLQYFTNKISEYLTIDKKDNYCNYSVPSKYIKKYNLIDDYSAYNGVHRPKSKDNLNDSLKVFKYEEALEYCIRSQIIRDKIYNKKKDTNTFIDKIHINDFVKKLDINLTHDQINATREIIDDMNDNHIMFRLLQGDVGTGKTIVAMIALYANFLRGKQGVLMAPTFELAMQHYNSALSLFKDCNINVSFLSGNKSKKQKENIVNDLKNGKIDILISTHSAIQENVEYKNLGLAIIDEQHRFGVKQRDALISKCSSLDVLMMSATPIPRTFAQMLNCDISLSTLVEFPKGTRNVQTRFVVSQDPIIYKAIRKAFDTGRQIYIVVPKIEESASYVKSVNEVYEDISTRFGKDNVAILHGKLKKDTQDQIISDFASGKRLILISTTVVEVGIDVVNAGLLIVYSANYFGLAQLHQLRGRIGRNGKFALNLLVYDGKDKSTIEKLNFLVSHDSGEDVAVYDMKTRGTGTYAGSSQSGNSDLRICNFIEDEDIFTNAREDASEILKNITDEENFNYINKLGIEKKYIIS